MIPVVLLHALGSSARTWETFAAALPRPSIALDLPGHGTAPHTGDYTFTARTWSGTRWAGRWPSFWRCARRAWSAAW
jgi:pimeloyl-ACP methyl ester carboxylesterase